MYMSTIILSIEEDKGIYDRSYFSFLIEFLFASLFSPSFYLLLCFPLASLSAFCGKQHKKQQKEEKN